MNTRTQRLAALTLAIAVLTSGCSNYKSYLPQSWNIKRAQDSEKLTREPRTFAMIKPEAVKAALTGKILARIEANGLRIVALKMVQIDLADAKRLYSAHKGKPFYDRLVRYITSGPVVVCVLEGDDCVHKYRELMGSTDPKMAARGSLRAEFAKSLEENAVHGSDALETAQEEIALFFPELR